MLFSWDLDYNTILVSTFIQKPLKDVYMFVVMCLKYAFM